MDPHPCKILVFKIKLHITRNKFFIYYYSFNKMNKCINKIVILSSNGGIFDDIIDCTYVLLCCGSNPQREKHVYTQLKLLNPSKQIILVYNSGYKTCEKTSSPTDDMTQAQLYIFNHALDNDYKRILYLEDDFFVKKALNPRDIRSICTFIKNHNPSIYGLCNVSLPTLSTLLSSHQKAFKNILYLAHAVIYNQKYMKETILFRANNSKEYMTDVVSGYIPNIENYRYYKPLIYQTFPPTENQKISWKTIFPKYLENIGINTLLAFIKLTNLYQKEEPGFTLIYLFPFIFYGIIFLLILFLIIFIYTKLKLKQSNTPV